MSDYKIWITGSGAVDVALTTLRPFHFYPMMSLISQGTATDIVFDMSGDQFNAHLTAAQVSQLRGSPTSAAAPYLFLASRAVIAPGAPDRKWGWRMRISRGGVALPAKRNNGSPLPLDSQGYVRSSLYEFPAGTSGASNLSIISLS